jgi:hypothetical protein
MKSMKILPPDYHLASIMNLAEPRTVVWLNLAAIPLLILFGWLFGRIVGSLNSSSPTISMIWTNLTTFSIRNLVGIIISILFMLILHELIHGAFFGFFTREIPRFALKSGYAFAAAPEWYVPKYQYIIVGLSPLLIISILSIVIGALTTPFFIPYIVLIAALNAAGALGDMIVVAWVTIQTNHLFVNDQGDIFTTYTLQDKVL